MTTCDDEILKGATNRGGAYSREAFIYLKIKKDEAFIRERHLIEEIRQVLLQCI